MRRKICVVSGSRADYGLLYWVIRKLHEAVDVELQLIATGMHLAAEFGSTVQAIEQDGFPIAARVEMLLSSDTRQGITKSLGIGVIGFADAFESLEPDILVLLGDRFEIFAAAQAAMIAGIPIAHIAGGDTTEGAIDEAIRHSITKMAHVHFATNSLSAARIRQLGEHPDQVHMVGSPGLDTLKRLQLLSREQIAADLHLDFGTVNLLVTYHPVTLDRCGIELQFAELSAALDTLPVGSRIFFTLSNADVGGRTLSALVENWAKGRSDAYCFTSLGQLRYLSLMSHVDVVVGNSSSGLYEAPSLHVPTVNIGDRQRGRLAADSVVHCKAERGAIRSAIGRALELDCSATQNPYGDGESAQRIYEVLMSIKDATVLLKKSFYFMREGRDEVAR